MDDIRSEVLAYLAKERLAVLSTLGSDGTIDANAVYFTNDEFFNFYVMTKTDTRKFRNMKAHPSVSLTIANEDHMKTVEIKGQAESLEFSKDVENRMADLVLKAKPDYGVWAPPISKLEAGEYTVLRIVPAWMRYGVFRNESPTREYFTQIVG